MTDNNRDFRVHLRQLAHQAWNNHSNEDIKNSNQWLDNFLLSVSNSQRSNQHIAVSELMKTPGRRRVGLTPSRSNNIQQSPSAGATSPINKNVDSVPTLLFPSQYSTSTIFGGSKFKTNKENDVTPASPSTTAVPVPTRNKPLFSPPRQYLPPPPAAIEQEEEEEEEEEQIRDTTDLSIVLEDEEGSIHSARTSRAGRDSAAGSETDDDGDALLVQQSLLRGRKSVSSTEVEERAGETKEDRQQTGEEQDPQNLSIIGEEEEEEDREEEKVPNVAEVKEDEAKLVLPVEETILSARPSTSSLATTVPEEHEEEEQIPSPVPASATAAKVIETVAPTAQLQPRTVEAAQTTTATDGTVPLNDEPSSLRNHPPSSSASQSTTTPSRFLRSALGSSPPTTVGRTTATTTPGSGLLVGRPSTGGGGGRATLNFVSLPKKSLPFALGRSMAGGASWSETLPQGSSQSQSQESVPSTSTTGTKRKSGVDLEAAAAKKSARLTLDPEEQEVGSKSRRDLLNRMNAMRVSNAARPSVIGFGSTAKPINLLQQHSVVSTVANVEHSVPSAPIQHHPHPPQTTEAIVKPNLVPSTSTSTAPATKPSVPTNIRPAAPAPIPAVPSYLSPSKHQGQAVGSSSGSATNPTSNVASPGASFLPTLTRRASVKDFVKSFERQTVGVGSAAPPSPSKPPPAHSALYRSSSILSPTSPGRRALPVPSGSIANANSRPTSPLPPASPRPQARIPVLASSSAYKSSNLPLSPTSAAAQKFPSSISVVGTSQAKAGTTSLPTDGPPSAAAVATTSSTHRMTLRSPSPAKSPVPVHQHASPAKALPPLFGGNGTPVKPKALAVLPVSTTPDGTPPPRAPLVKQRDMGAVPMEAEKEIVIPAVPSFVTQVRTEALIVKEQTNEVQHVQLEQEQEQDVGGHSDEEIYGVDEVEVTEEPLAGLRAVPTRHDSSIFGSDQDEEGRDDDDDKYPLPTEDPYGEEGDDEGDDSIMFIDPGQAALAVAMDDTKTSMVDSDTFNYSTFKPKTASASQPFRPAPPPGAAAKSLKPSPSKVVMPGAFEGDEDEVVDSDNDVADGLLNPNNKHSTAGGVRTIKKQGSNASLASHASSSQQGGSRPASQQSQNAAGGNFGFFSRPFGGPGPSSQQPGKVKSIQMAAAAAKKEKEERDRKAALKEETAKKRLAISQKRQEEERIKAEEVAERKRKERDEAVQKAKIRVAMTKAKEVEESNKKRKIEAEVKRTEVKKAPPSVSRPFNPTSSYNNPNLNSSLSSSVGRAGMAGPSNPLKGSQGSALKASGPATINTSSMVGVKYMNDQVRIQGGVAPAGPPRFGQPPVSKPFPPPSTQQPRAPPSSQSRPAPAPEQFIELPDIDSEYSNSDDEGHDEKVAAYPSWVKSPLNLLAMQQHTNPDDIFGPMPPLSMKDVFKQNHARFTKRSSSAQWAGTDEVTEAEVANYTKVMGFR